MHNHTLHDILHQIHVFLFEIGMQNEEGFLQPTKASERPSRRKKINFDESKSSKNFKSQPN